MSLDNVVNNCPIIRLSREKTGFCCMQSLILKLYSLYSKRGSFFVSRFILKRYFNKNLYNQQISFIGQRRLGYNHQLLQFSWLVESKMAG